MRFRTWNYSWSYNRRRMRIVRVRLGFYCWKVEEGGWKMESLSKGGREGRRRDFKDGNHASYLYISKFGVCLQFCRIRWQDQKILQSTAFHQSNKNRGVEQYLISKLRHPLQQHNTTQYRLWTPRHLAVTPLVCNAHSIVRFVQNPSEAEPKTNPRRCISQIDRLKTRLQI